MKQIYKMAFRNLARNRRRSLLSALALGMGLSLLLLMASVVEGEMRGAMQSSIALQSGHLQVRAKSYDEDKTSLAWEDLVEDPDSVAEQIASMQPVEAATPRLFASGILAMRDQSVGVRIVGIDPPSAASAPFRDGLVSGSFLDAADRTGILIGQPLADKLALVAGDKATLLVNTSNGDVDEQPFVIRGTYSTRTPAFDESTIFMPLAKMQAITRTEGHASTIFVLLREREQTDAVAAALQTVQYRVTTWEQMNELLIETEQFAGAYMILLYLIVLAITATVIINALVMAVFERTREIAILSAIGMESGRIMAMFLAEASILAVGGIGMGLALGGSLVAYASKYGFFIGDLASGVSGMLFSERIYAYLTPDDTITLAVGAFFVTLLAGLYPAMLAARMEPVQALHGGQQS